MKISCGSRCPIPFLLPLSVEVIHIQLFNQLFTRVKLCVMVEFECSFIELPYVRSAFHLLQIGLQGGQLIVRSLVIRQNGNTILELESIRICSVVDQNHFGQISVNYPEVLDMPLIFKHIAVMPIQTVVEYFPLWVKFIQYGVCIGVMACSKDDNLELLSHLFQKCECIRSNVNSHFHISLISLESQLYIRFCARVFNAVNQSFIQIQYQRFFLVVHLALFQVQFSILHFGTIRNLKIFTPFQYSDGSIDVLHSNTIFLVDRSYHLAHIVCGVAPRRVGIDVGGLKIFWFGVIGNQSPNFFFSGFQCDAGVCWLRLTNLFLCVEHLFFKCHISGFLFH